MAGQIATEFQGMRGESGFYHLLRQGELECEVVPRILKKPRRQPIDGGHHFLRRIELSQTMSHGSNGVVRGITTPDQFAELLQGVGITTHRVKRMRGAREIVHGGIVAPPLPDHGDLFIGELFTLIGCSAGHICFKLLNLLFDGVFDIQRELRSGVKALLEKCQRFFVEPLGAVNVCFFANQGAGYFPHRTFHRVDFASLGSKDEWRTAATTN